MSESAKDQESYRKEPRRRFSAAHKCEVVEAMLSSTMSLARFAREHNLNHNQLARWRREYDQGKYAAVATSESAFVPVCIESAVRRTPAKSPPITVGTIALHLPKGRLVMQDISPAFLRELIEALQ